MSIEGVARPIGRVARSIPHEFQAIAEDAAILGFIILAASVHHELIARIETLKQELGELEATLRSRAP